MTFIFIVVDEFDPEPHLHHRQLPHAGRHHRQFRHHGDHHRPQTHLGATSSTMGGTDRDALSVLHHARARLRARKGAQSRQCLGHWLGT